MGEEPRDIYHQVVDITSDYLGPASKRFIDRQIINHLDKSPEELTRKDLTELIKWIQICTALLTEDKDLVEEFSRRLQSLAKNHKQTAG